jgi:hypothetical protein
VRGAVLALVVRQCISASLFRVLYFKDLALGLEDVKSILNKDFLGEKLSGTFLLIRKCRTNGRWHIIPNSPTLKNASFLSELFLMGEVPLNLFKY